jgi:hypothetical protein
LDKRSGGIAEEGARPSEARFASGYRVASPIQLSISSIGTDGSALLFLTRRFFLLDMALSARGWGLLLLSFGDSDLVASQLADSIHGPFKL